MDLKTIQAKARERLGNICKVCVSCNGNACAGKVPGVGGVGTGSSFKANIKALEEVRLNMRTIGGTIPSTEVNMFGHQLKAPILGAPIAGMTYNYGDVISEEEYAENTIAGCAKAGLIGMTGDGLSSREYPSGIEAIKKKKGLGIPVLKPGTVYQVMEKIKEAKEVGAPAVGMDIDGTGLVALKTGVPPMGEKDLSSVINSTELPFILKGIMTVEEAIIAAEVGAKAIVVSNHGGRVLDGTPGTAHVLPQIANAVRDRVLVLVDGGIRTGIDVLRMLGLGAHGVLIGRPLVVGNLGAGALGVSVVLEKIIGELVQGMVMTGCNDVDSINKDIIWGDE
ncbi:isopentenyl diphosphate isomerase/L-lactate dehydrogenase-like FMN-dependent dehydrogenase [Desulfitispora alkaliphila]|uniref:alpha-hydroxy-acid oxidizing protein n=1 Tax=Desulfitispora alkaliphila TaxID=622674 RepID=UPI003D1ADAD8